MLIWLGAIAIGLALGLLGGGGSILTVPLLVYGFELEPKAAIATSLLVVGVTSGIAAIPYARRGLVCARVGLVFGVAAMLGGYGGGWLARFIPGQALLTGFAILMLATALAMLRRRKTGEVIASGLSPCPAASGEFPLGRILLHGLVTGGVTGLVGAGGGFLVVPALTLFGGLSMHAAVGTSVLIVTLKSFAALAGYLQHVDIDYGIALPMTLMAAAGTVLGSFGAQRVSAYRLRQGFGLFVLAMAGVLFYREFPVGRASALIAEYPALVVLGFAGLTAAVLGWISARTFMARGSCVKHHWGH